MALTWTRVSVDDDHRLLHVSRAVDARVADHRSLPAVLLVPGFIQNRHAFALPGRSLVEHLAGQGYAVHVVDLPGRAMRHPARRRDRLLEYVEIDVARLVEQTADAHPMTAYIGHSMGGLIGVALPPPVVARLSCVVTIGSPLLPGEKLVRSFARPVEGVARLAGMAGAAFPGRRIATTLFRARAAFGGRLIRLPMRVWSPGALDDDELSFVLEHAFANDSFGAAADLLALLRTRGGRMGHVPIGERLAMLRAPLLVIGGNDDGLAPEDAVRAVFDRAGSRDKALHIVGERGRGRGVGHVDLLVGRRAPELVWPLIDAFLARHAPPSLALGSSPDSA